MTDYHINIFASSEDDGHIADIPDLACCSAFGATPEEALAEVLVARAAWLEAARAEGKPIPTPKYKPAVDPVARARRAWLASVPSHGAGEATSAAAMAWRVWGRPGRNRRSTSRKKA